ncbi:ankyrin repeat domain-containing protein 26-like [Rattus rattus]|uniref:ankyrin repeat domain-containing protein 26-like n=1 Tax=Rattus rattus TaxID=10117 RepID=UPI0013F2FEB0|nr:ankyrin repeat domain-containing protein 26-like [Rattus rattus]
MKRIFKGHSPWGFLSFRHAENQEPPRYLTGYTPVKRIHKAASVGDIPQVQKLLEFGNIDVNITDRKKRTALHYACAHGQSEMVSLLLWYDCNIEARDREESTALIKATQRQHEICVKILLENGADPNAVDVYHITALHYAVYNNDTAIAAKLLSFNANTEIKTKNGYTPLILAVLENKQEMVELLLRAAANINAVDNCKRSALIHAVRIQSKNMISLLLQQGADPSLVDIYGATAQSYAVFETFQVLSQSPGPGPELTTKEDKQSFDTKDGCIPHSHHIKEDNQGMEENTDDKLESSAQRRSNSEPTEDDEPSFSTKPPVAQSPMFTESSLWVGYPADWPEPVKFSRQPAVYNPTEWREDMESRSVPQEESKQQVAIFPEGKEADAQTQELLSRVFKESGDNDPNFPAIENTKDELVSLLAPLEENKPQMTEFPLIEAAKFQTDVQLDRQGVLKVEEKGLEICQDRNLEAAESAESYSMLRFSTNRDISDPEPTTRKDELKLDTKDKDGLEKHPLASRASQHQAKKLSLPPSQLQERPQETEMDTTSDEEDTSGLSKSANGQMPGRKLREGEKLEGKQTAQRVINKPTQKGGELYEGVKANVYHKEEQPPDVSGKAHLKSVPTNLAYNMLDCGDRDVTAGLVSAALRSFPRQKEGGLGNAFPSPSSSSSRIVESSGHSLTKFSLMKNKLDCENNTSELEESFHKRKEKSSKNAESRKVRGKCPEVRVGEKQEGQEFKGQLQKCMKPKRTDGQLDIGHMHKSSDASRLSNAKERSHVSEIKSWGDSILHVSDMYGKSQGTQDLSPKPLPCKGNCEAPACTLGLASDAPPGGRTARAFGAEELQNRLSDSEFRILEEEILAWEKVHLENESVSENLLKKCEGIISDATDQQEHYLETVQAAAETDSEGTSQPEQKDLDSSESPQLSDPALSKTCPQTQNTPVDPSTPTCPLSEKDSKQIHTPPLHLKRMSEDLEIDKKLDRECAPGHPEVPSVKAHGRESLTRDTVGSNGEPKSSSELQHSAGDALENIGPVEEPLPGNCRRTQFKVEEITKKQPSVESEEPENLCLTVAGFNDNQLVFERNGGKTGELFPAEEKDELPKSVPDSWIKEEKSSEKEAWGPPEPVVTPVFEESPPEAAGLLPLKDGHLLTKMDPVERRLTKRDAKEKNKTGTQVNETEEGSRGCEPCATASGRGSRIPMKLWDTARSDERLAKLRKSHCELLTRKLGKVGDKASGVQREQTEIKKPKSWSRHKEVAWGELCDLRFPLKQDEKQENVEFMFPQKKPRLRREEEQHGGSVERTQRPEIRTVISELKALEKDLRQLHNLKESWETTYYKYLHMVVKLQFIEQELIAIKTEQKKCGHLLENQKNLEKEVLDLKSWMREIETQARDQNNIKILRDTNDAAMIHQMDLRIKNMESQLAMTGAQQHEGEMSKYKPHHADEEGCQNRSPTMQERVAWPSQ